jgi:hypothetical protein
MPKQFQALMSAIAIVRPAAGLDIEDAERRRKGLDRCRSWRIQREVERRGEQQSSHFRPRAD